MEKRRLGRTGHLSTVVILGAAAFGKAAQKEVDEAMELTLQHGVNHIDVAPTYGEAELRLGPWLKEHRKEFFLACKTTKRTRTEAWEELQRSLERLQVDSFDLYQMHSLAKLEELEVALGPGGAVEAFLEAKEKGLTRYLGITGHGLTAPSVHATAIERFPFDTVLNALNFVLWADPDYRRDYEHLMQLARKKDVGLMVIKAWAKAPWGERPRTHTTWYEPFNDQASMDRCLRFVLSQEGITGAASSGDVRLLPMILDAAERYAPLSQAEQAALLSRAHEFQSIF